MRTAPRITRRRPSSWTRATGSGCCAKSLSHAEASPFLGLSLMQASGVPIERYSFETVEAMSLAVEVRGDNANRFIEPRERDQYYCLAILLVERVLVTPVSIGSAKLLVVQVR